MVPLFLVNRFGPQAAKLVFYGGILLALVLVVGAVYLVGRGDGKRAEVVEQLQQELDTKAEVKEADTKAAATRLDDAVRTEQEAKELDDAIKAIENPDDQRAVRGCVIMRQQGYDTSRIPACSGSAHRP